MDQGLISPLTCGFPRVAAYWSTKEAKSLFPSNKKLAGNSEFLQKRFSIFEKVFTSRKEAFNVDFRHFNKKILKLESTIDHWNFRRADEEQIFSSTFSISNLRELAFDKKQQHTFTSCQGCYMDFSSALSLFPVKSNYLKKCLSSTPVSVAQKCLQNRAKAACLVEGSSSQFIEHAKLTKQKQTTQRNAVSNGKILYDKINAPFRQIHNIDFSKALAKVDGINLQNKMQKHVKRKGHSMSVLPYLLSICICSSLLMYIRLSLFWIVLSIGPEVFLLAHPKASNFELKSPTNMTLSEGC